MEKRELKSLLSEAWGFKWISIKLNESQEGTIRRNGKNVLMKEDRKSEEKAQVMK